MLINHKFDININKKQDQKHPKAKNIGHDREDKETTQIFLSKRNEESTSV